MAPAPASSKALMPLKSRESGEAEGTIGFLSCSPLYGVASLALLPLQET